MKNQVLKKGLAWFLTAVLTVGILPILPCNTETIKAEETEQDTKGPGVLMFATKDDIMERIYYGENGEYRGGQILFGKNEAGEAQRWYVLDREELITEDNVILFSTTPLIEEQVFTSNVTEDMTYDKKWGCTYEDGDEDGKTDEPVTVYPNHYGASDLRKKLNEIAKDNKFFSDTEQKLMNEVEVTSSDGMNSSWYFTKDKLYVPAVDYRYDTVYAGANDFDLEIVGEEPVIIESEMLGEGRLWSRVYGYGRDGGSVIDESVTGTFEYVKVSEKYAVRPILNLDLQSVLFASVVPQASSDGQGDVWDTGYSEKSESGEIIDKPAMTLRLSGAGIPVGSAIYNESSIFAKKADGAENATLVVQGEDWYYNRVLNEPIQVTIEDIPALKDSSDVSFDDCKIWVETIRDGMSYADMAIKGQTVNKVFVTDITPPTGGAPLDRQASCTTEGVATTTPTVTYTTGDGKPVTEEKACWLTEYVANVTISPDMQNGKVFSNGVVISINGNEATKTVHPDGSITASYIFTTGIGKITEITAPDFPANNTFANYYTKDTVLTAKELGDTATVTFEDNTNTGMSVKWELNGEVYNEVPGAENQFRWTIDKAQYDGKYDLNNCNPTGIVTIRNKSAAAVTVTGTDATVKYNGETIDISKYFNIGENAGVASYSLVNGAGTGEGTLVGTILTVTKTGTFVIRLKTAVNGIYGEAEALSILTVGEGVFENDARDYSGAYDGQPHGITVAVAEAGDAVITYSTDGMTYNTVNPKFTDKGTYTVHYKIEKPNHTTVTGSRTVTIYAKDITIMATDQELVWGTDVDQSKYTVAEGALAEGEQISRITLTSSTTEFTENGIVAANDAKIVNAEGRDVTANYNISYVNGKLVIKHNEILAPTELTVAKTITTYTAGLPLQMEDLVVKASYPDGYVEIVTDYETNADVLDMATAGDKILTVSFARNGKILTKDITITVISAPVVPDLVTKYKVTVNNGTGDGEYEAGQSVTITADESPEGKQFKGWAVVSGGVILADSTSTAIAFEMPTSAVEVTAMYEDKVISTTPPTVEPPVVEPPTVEPPVVEQPPTVDQPAVEQPPTVDPPVVEQPPIVESPAIEQPTVGSSVAEVPATKPSVVNLPVKEMDKFTDTKSNGTYKVTGADTVEYVKSSNRNAKVVTIPANVTANGKNYRVTSVAANAFKNSKKLTKVTMGSNIEKIGANAFFGCIKLKKVKLGRNLLTMGNKVFYKCTALTSIEIPAKVSKIGKQAFYGCKKLKKIRIVTDKLTAKSIGSKAFKGIYSNARITVPKGKVKEYGTLLREKM